MKTTGLSFIEAVQALNEKRCKYIENEKGQWYCLNGSGALVTKNSFNLSITAEEMLTEIYNLVDPVKQYEEVEVVVDKNSPNNVWFIDERGYTKQPPKDAEITIKFKREIKPKVKHRKLLYETDQNGYPSKGAIINRANSKVWAEWESEEE